MEVSKKVNTNFNCHWAYKRHRPYKNQPITTKPIFIAPNALVIITGKLRNSIPYKIQIIAPDKRNEYVKMDISLALLVLNILYACGKFANPPTVPKIVAKIDNIVILCLSYNKNI